MNPPSSPKAGEDIRQALPFVRQEAGLRQQIQNRWKQSGHKIIVLDDDPTGVQTVHDIDVITDWSRKWIWQGLQGDGHLLYILTNTRSYQPERAAEINRQIMQNLVEVARELAVEFSVISRGDSTLRGHYPLELDVIGQELSREAGWEHDGHLIIPAFMEGGRYTIHDTHYLQEGDTLVPVHETEFAKDVVFGFSNAHLPSWVIEKGGAESIDQVQTISLEDIRLGGVVRVHSLLLAATGNKPIIVNAASYEDLDIVSVALIRAMEMGKRFLFRTAASFVKSFAGIEDRPLLTAREMIAADGKHHGGLIIVGSHTKKTTEQLQEVIDQFDIQTIEISVADLLDETASMRELIRVREAAEKAMAAGRDTVIFTSRQLVTARDRADNLTISQTVSNSLAEVVRSLTVTPKFIVAKGGITSSDIATQGLAIKKAKVLGQAAPGIPVWVTGPEAHLPHTPYIVFPGNVGNRFTLAEIIGTIKNTSE